MNVTEMLYDEVGPFLEYVVWSTWLSVLIAMTTSLFTNAFSFFMTFQMETNASGVTWIQALSLSELAMAIINMKISLGHVILGRWITYHWEWVCKLWTLVLFFFGNMYVYFYVALVADRAIAVSLPVFYMNHCKKQNVRIFALLIALVCFLITLPVFFFAGITDEGSCSSVAGAFVSLSAESYDWVMLWHDSFNSFYVMWVPVLGMTVFSVIIVVKVVQRKSGNDFRLTMTVLTMGICTIISIILEATGWDPPIYLAPQLIDGDFAYGVALFVVGLNSIANIGFYWLAPSVRVAMKKSVKKMLRKK